MRKRILAALFAPIAAVIVLFGGLTFASAASAGDDHSQGDECVPSAAHSETTYIEHPAVTHTETRTVIDAPAWTETVTIEAAHWQRYSWTGGPHTSDDAPAFPSSDWQPNVQGDPHNIGVVGAYYRSNGNSGNGDWFYLDWVEAVIETIEHPAITHEETVTITDEEAWTETIIMEYPEVTCPEPTTEPTTEP